MKYKRILMLFVFFVGIAMVLYPIVSKKFYEDHLNKVVANFNQSTERVSETLSDTNIVNDDIFATIEIPKIKLNLPIYYGASDEILSKGIGLIENMNTSIGGINTHSILAGHSGIASIELFTNIHKLEFGDTFKVHMVDEELEYKVIDNRKIKVTETEYLKIQKEKDLVTLLTCPTFDSKRYRIIVIGERIMNDESEEYISKIE